MKLLQGATQEKILGTVWNHAKDMLLSNVNPPNDITLTERTVLSQIARILFWSSWIRSSLPNSRENRNAASVTTSLRMGSRAAFSNTGRMDSFLPRNGRLESRDLWKIPYPSGHDCIPNTLYLFWRIQRSLCACAYVRWWIESNEYDTWFIAAKSRVAPLKPLGIPRLELQAAVLATRLYQSISEESRLQFEKVVFVSDSNIVLSWIPSQAREFKPCVRSSCRDSKQFWPISVETCPRRVKCRWWRLSWYAGTTTDWQMEAGARILTTARRGVASRQFNSWPEWSRKGTP